MGDERPPATADTTGPATSAAGSAAASAGPASKQSGGNEGDAAGSAPATTITLAKQGADLVFDARRNAFYHAARRGFYERLHKGVTAVSIFGGSAAFAAIGQSWPEVAMAAAAIAAVASATDLVFAFGARASEHAQLSQRSAIVAVEAFEIETEVDFRSVRRAMNLLYVDERPPMRAVDAVAFNAASLSLYGEAGLRVVVTKWQSAMRHLLPFNASEFPLVKTES